ncbi:MAG: hypothetical protein ACK5TF_03675, partial [bacterium]
MKISIYSQKFPVAPCSVIFPNPFSGNHLPEQFSYFMSSNALTDREHLIELYNRGERNFAEVR